MKSKTNTRKNIYIFLSQKNTLLSLALSLIPENDPTTLFISAGMHPLVPFLMGEKHPQGNRLVNVQKCIRTIDIDEVGDAYHHTFFEMLGNWSLGDYFKKEAIEWSFEFLTKELNIPMERLAVSVFKGDDNASLDQESINIWKKVGIPESRIAKLSKKIIGGDRLDKLVHVDLIQKCFIGLIITKKHPKNLILKMLVG